MVFGFPYVSFSSLDELRARLLMNYMVIKNLSTCQFVPLSQISACCCRFGDIFAFFVMSYSFLNGKLYRISVPRLLSSVCQRLQRWHASSTASLVRMPNSRSKVASTSMLLIAGHVDLHATGACTEVEVNTSRV